jgi:dolichyl-phosphate-mannose-protein mannosyltransferase
MRLSNELTCNRQLFLHHYFPALYFAIIVVAQIFDFAFTRVTLPRELGSLTLKSRPIIGQATAVLILLASVAVFSLYAPLAYGNTWTKAECNRVKLFDTWDWDCNTFLDSYADYSLAVPSANGPAPTGSQAALHGPAPPVAEDPAKEVVVTPGQQQVLQGAVTEEKIEYRDEKGNLLDEEQVKALEGKVSFSTRYETRTRLVDAQGNEIYNEVVEPGQDAGFAGSSADGPDPATGNEAGEAQASTKPGSADAASDVAKEKAVEGKATAEAESGAAEATKDEL